MLGIGSRVNHPTYGKGVVLRVKAAAYEVCFVEEGIKHVGKTYKDWDIIEAIEAEEIVTFSEAEKSLAKVLKTWLGVTEEVEMGQRWEKGKLILKPNNEDLASKEIPIETFFSKIIMVRERLRLIEQRINNSKSLTTEEKVNLQQYITRSYGSLTSFNVLFKHKEDQFKGVSSK